MNHQIYTITKTLGLSLLILAANSVHLFAQATPWLGVEISKHSKGVMIEGVIEGSSADKGKLEPGDLLTKIDNVVLKSPKELISYVQSKPVGTNVKLEFMRNLKPQKKIMKLTAKPSEEEAISELHMNKPMKDYALNVFAYDPITKSVKNYQTSVSKIKKKSIVLKFWATWCPACLSTHSLINQKLLNNKDVEVLAITNEKDTKAITDFIITNKPKFLIVQDKGYAIRKEWYFSAIPAFAATNQKRVVKYIKLGTVDTMKKTDLITKKETEVTVSTVDMSFATAKK